MEKNDHTYRQNGKKHTKKFILGCELSTPRLTKFLNPIQLAAPKLARSRVQIYYNDFKQGTNYCVDIRAIKLWKLGNMQNAGVIVFDHNDNGKFFLIILNLFLMKFI